MKTRRSKTLYEKAKKILPGGVNSPVRAFRSVGTDPIFVKRAKGAYVWDEDGNRYIDYIGSWGPMILGHAHPRILKALRGKIKDGTSFGASTELEVKMAELITKIVPSIEMVRMVNSGTEATMSAIRLARAFTGKEKIIKFEGCYHGHGDAFLIKAGSGAMTLGVPDSPGVPAAVASGTLTARYNDPQSVERLVATHRGEIAAIIVEPIVGNMGCIPPRQGFLEGLRAVCDRETILLIFDEVMTGFRVALGGAQELYGVKPDLTTLGKIIGGGLPVGAYGGKREIMQMVAPAGPVYQAGTLSGNPLAMAAGYEMLTILSRQRRIYKKLEEMGKRLEEGIQEVLERSGLPYQFNRVGSMFTLFFTDKPVTDYDSAKRSDTTLYSRYFRAVLAGGILLPPSQFEAAFISTNHRNEEITTTLAAIQHAISSMRL
ncbi:MAG TPA: glutamate-1-semialdehyde 2,1-aminomutase [Bacteroidota bacterium]|nr:glutamate-1-semialdehyde 2,1-aminomutase [Bacteroidota bacterium]